MRIRTQLALTMLLFGAVAAGISTSAIVTGRHVERANQQDTIAHSIALGASELSYLANDYLMYRESQQLERWDARFASFSGDVASLQADDPARQALVDNIQDNAQRLEDVFRSVASLLGNLPADQEGSVDPAMLRVSWSRLAVQTQALVSDASRLSLLLGDEVDRLQRTNLIVVLALIGVFGAYFLVNYLIIQRGMLRSIARLQAGAAIIGAGNLDFRMEQVSRDEIGDVSRAFSQMAADLESTSEAVQIERQRLYNVLETLPAMICLLTPDYRIAFANRSFREKFGESRGQHCYESCFGQTTPCEFCQSYRVLETGEPQHWEVTTPDGATVIDVYDFPFIDVDGTPMILEMDIDITEQRAAEAALLQAERLAVAGKMAASLAHEIGNPLQAVVGCLDLAVESLAGGQEPGQYLEIAQSEVQRTARIVGQLRSLGRPVQDGPEQPLDLNGLLDDVLVLSKKHLQDHNIQVIWEPGEEQPRVVVRSDAMRQVFLNLVLNAVDAMPGGGQLRLATETAESPPGVRVVVADTGVGIAPEVVPRIFDAFYSTKSVGMGVGLFVSQSIVQQHGGRLEVESELDVGTTFTVWLPGSTPESSSVPHVF